MRRKREKEKLLRAETNTQRASGEEVPRGAARGTVKRFGKGIAFSYESGDQDQEELVSQSATEKWTKGNVASCKPRSVSYESEGASIQR
jgi:hypothetical protein